MPAREPLHASAPPRLFVCSCLQGICHVTYSPAHGASIVAEGCQVLHHHAAPAWHLLPSITAMIHCQCTATTPADDSDHDVHFHAKEVHDVHNVLEGILRQAIDRMGVASTLQPTLCKLAGLEVCACGGAARAEAVGLEMGGILLA
jgi:hypothetical protein